MYRVCMTRIPVINSLYFGWRALFVGEGVVVRRANAMEHMVAARMKVSADEESRGMATMCGCCCSVCSKSVPGSNNQ